MGTALEAWGLPGAELQSVLCLSLSPCGCCVTCLKFPKYIFTENHGFYLEKNCEKDAVPSDMFPGELQGRNFSQLT